MKAISYAAQSVMLGHASVVVAGGMESMSNVPYYMLSARNGLRYGHGEITDGIIKDGLWDVYNNIHMGSCAEKTAADYAISRAAQDEYAVMSYKRANAASDAGKFKPEIVGVPVKGKKGETLVSWVPLRLGSCVRERHAILLPGVALTPRTTVAMCAPID